MQRSRVRASMIRADPGGASQRSMKTRIFRRTYKVAGSNSLWHIDGNHKLIRYYKLISNSFNFAKLELECICLPFKLANLLMFPILTLFCVKKNHLATI